jgi:hypothetical protein
MDLKEIDWKVIDWINMPQDRDKCWVAENLQVP